jgi:hypothetical protein
MPDLSVVSGTRPTLYGLVRRRGMGGGDAGCGPCTVLPSQPTGLTGLIAGFVVAQLTCFAELTSLSVEASSVRVAIDRLDSQQLDEP